MKAAPAQREYKNSVETTAQSCGGDVQIILATINARYIHAAVGLRYLMANLAEMQSVTRILEFEIKQRALDIAGEILAVGARIVGLGVYI